LRATNPARDDQGYEAAVGQYGWTRLDLGWDRIPHVLSHTARTIFQLNEGGLFSLPPTLRPSIAADTNAAACGALIRWNCPVEYGRGSPAIAAPQRNFIRDTISGLLRPVDLEFDTDVARADLKLTPTDDWRFDVGYSNIRRQRFRPAGTVIGSPGGAVTELAIPIENYTHEVKVGAEFKQPTWGVQFGYTGSIFRNEFTSYTWDNPGYFGATDSADFVAAAGRAVRVNQGQFAAPPDSFAHTFTGTGTLALPLRTRLSGTVAYSLLRQDETFLLNTVNRAIPQTNRDDAGASSPDAKHDIVLANFLATSRPIQDVTATARYRYFKHENKNPRRTFSTSVPEGLGVQTHTTLQEGFRKQNAGLDLGWRVIRELSLKGGYEFEHWNRGDREVTATDEHIGKFAADVTPVDWFLGRVTYRHGDRTVDNYQGVPIELPQLRKFDEADRRQDRVDLFLELSPWDTLTPSLNFGYARDDFHRSAYGLKKSDYWSAGGSLGWSPVVWLTLSADYAYEQYKYRQQSRYRPFLTAPAPGQPPSCSGPPAGGGPLDCPENDWDSRSKDEFHTVGLSAGFDLGPKKFTISLGYALTFGRTTIRSDNLGRPTVGTTGSAAGVVTATALDFDQVRNVLHTFRFVARYQLTKSLSARLGYAYERYTEKDLARDPLSPFVGTLDTSNAGIQSVFLGATQPNYEAHIASFVLRYEF
jgi:MtrB/PioB family decaheme-associated outer membrane protein